MFDYSLYTTEPDAGCLHDITFLCAEGVCTWRGEPTETISDLHLYIVKSLHYSVSRTGRAIALFCINDRWSHSTFLYQGQVES